MMMAKSNRKVWYVIVFTLIFLMLNINAYGEEQSKDMSETIELLDTVCTYVNCDYDMGYTMIFYSSRQDIQSIDVIDDTMKIYHSYDNGTFEISPYKDRYCVKISLDNLFVYAKPQADALNIRIHYSDNSSEIMENVIYTVDGCIVDDVSIYSAYDNTDGAVYVYIRGCDIHLEQLLFTITDTTNGISKEIGYTDSYSTKDGSVLKFQITVTKESRYMLSLQAKKNCKVYFNNKSLTISGDSVSFPKIYYDFYNPVKNQVTLAVSKSLGLQSVEVYYYTYDESGLMNKKKGEYTAKGSAEFVDGVASFTMFDKEGKAFKTVQAGYIRLYKDTECLMTHAVSWYNSDVKSGYSTVPTESENNGYATLLETNSSVSVTRPQNVVDIVYKTGAIYGNQSGEVSNYSVYYETGNIKTPAAITECYIEKYTNGKSEYAALIFSMDVSSLEPGTYYYTIYYKNNYLKKYTITIREEDTKFIIYDRTVSWDYVNDRLCIHFKTNRHFAIDRYKVILKDEYGNPIEDYTVTEGQKEDSLEEVCLYVSGKNLRKKCNRIYYQIEDTSLKDSKAYNALGEQYYSGYGALYSISSSALFISVSDGQRLCGTLIENAVYPVNICIRKPYSDKIIYQTTINRATTDNPNMIFIPGEIREKLDPDILYTIDFLDNSGQGIQFFNTFIDTQYANYQSTDVASIAGYAAQIGDCISLQVYVKASTDLLSLPDKILAYELAGERYTVSGEKTTLSGQPVLVYSINVAAAQMSDVIKLSFCANGKEYASATYSVRQYLNDMLNNSNYAMYSDIAKSMLNYGAYAQIYFDYNTSKPANSGIADNVKTADITMDAVYKTYGINTVEASSVDGKLVYSGASLVCEDYPYLRLYFKYDKNSSNLNFETTYNVNVYNGNYLLSGGSHYTIHYLTDEVLYVQLNDLYMSTMDDVYRVIIQEKQNNMNRIDVKYSPYTYIYYAQNCKDTNLKYLTKAIFLYCQALKEYYE